MGREDRDVRGEADAEHLDGERSLERDRHDRIRRERFDIDHGGSGEDAAQFLDALGNALRTGDTNFLVSRLNPAVINRYGSAQCLGALAAARDTSATFTVKQVSDPADFDWTTDGKTISIAETVTVDVDRVQRGVAESASLHVVQVGGRFTWLVDCGNPIGP